MTEPKAKEPNEFAVPLDKATAMLDVRDDRVHTFRDAGMMLIGADWPLPMLLKTMEQYGVSEAGVAASAMGHALVVTDDRGPMFLATKTTKKPANEAHEVFENLKALDQQEEILSRVASGYGREQLARLALSLACRDLRGHDVEINDLVVDYLLAAEALLKRHPHA